MSRSPKTVELRSPTSGHPALVINMLQQDDRLVTEMSLLQDDKMTALLRSIEGEANQLWPPSPALQEVVPQENEAGPFLAGVGQAGKSHWSVIVTPLDSGIGIEFDFACRIKTEAEWLGSTYEFLGDWATTTKKGQAEINVGKVRICFYCESADKSEIRHHESRIAVAASDTNSPALPRTVRWKYRFRLAT